MGRQAWVVKGDMSTEAGVDGVADALLHLHAQWHILINNHGANAPTPLLDAVTQVSALPFTDRSCVT
jgi:NAD(P)-dependent dehydrogenase (short-subunit alcohol dehydrogenase family)